MAQDPYKYFRPEARDILEQFSRNVLDLEKSGSGNTAVQHLLRLAHTLKGAARVVKQSEIANRAHAIEDELEPLRDSAEPIGRDKINAILEHIDAIGSQVDSLTPSAAAHDNQVSAIAAPAQPAAALRTIRADLAEADAVLESVSEAYALVGGLRTSAQGIVQTMYLAESLVAHFSVFEREEHDRRSDAHPGRQFKLAEELRRKLTAIDRNFGSAIDRLDRELRQLREATERLRLMPTQNLFTTLERVAWDTASALSKQVVFKPTGGNIRLEVHVLETLQGALIQIVRNAVAHGIEAPEVRLRAGKQAAGCVSVSISRRGGRVVFSCTDDGCGVDVDAVRGIAEQRADADPAGNEADVLRLLLRGGISTSKTVTEVAGRGIGLDVVREAAAQLGGEVGLRTAPGAGTTFELVIPPSLSALDALMVEGGAGSVVAIPLDAVRSIRRAGAEEISFTAPNASMLYDGKAIPFVPLAAAMTATPWLVGRGWAVVIVAGASGLAAIGVEKLLGAANIVVRSLPQDMKRTPIVAAASLDVEGNPQLILDPDNLVTAAQRGSAGARAAREDRRPVLVVDDSLTTRMLEQSILESAGFDVDLAISGEDALERMCDKRYALVLVDVEMPGMDGFTFVERIRSDAKSRDIPAIMVTSLADPVHRQRSRDVGAQGYVVKSEFDQAKLLSMIEQQVA
jgi:two-component system chemotaxis sensor kinase CheA